MSAQERSTELLSQQRKRMQLLRDRETPARRSVRLDSYICVNVLIHVLSCEAFCTMCISSKLCKFQFKGKVLYLKKTMVVLVGMIFTEYRVN